MAHWVAHSVAHTVRVGPGPVCVREGNCLGSAPLLVCVPRASRSGRPRAPGRAAHVGWVGFPHVPGRVPACIRPGFPGTPGWVRTRIRPGFPGTPGWVPTCIRPAFPGAPGSGCPRSSGRAPRCTPAGTPGALGFVSRCVGPSSQVCPSFVRHGAVRFRRAAEEFPMSVPWFRRLPVERECPEAVR